MVGRIFRKDWILLWPLAVLLIAIQAGFDWAFFKTGLVVGNPLAGELSRILGVAWIVGAVALTVLVVQEDAIPGAEQDWLVRPVRRTDLLLAKVLFVLATTTVPMVVINLLHELARGFPLGPSLEAAIYKGIFVFLCLSIPAMALAAITRNLTEVLIAAAGLVVLYASCLWLSAGLFGARRCPTCDTGIVWLQHMLQHVELLIGSAVILGMQYYRRKTSAARWLAIIGIGVLVFAQLPWAPAFRLQTRLSSSSDASAGVLIESDGGSIETPSRATERLRPRNLARQATQELMHGELNAAVGDLKRFSRPDDAPVIVSFPLRIAGMAAGEFLIVDRVEYAFTDARGQVLYRSVKPAEEMILHATEGIDTGSGAEQSRQELAIPRSDFEPIRAVATRLDVNYSVTLMRLGAQYRVRADEGVLRAAGVGLCETKPDADQVRLRCEQVGQTPFCYSATLFGILGQHNPEKLQCSPDYRPYIPSVTNILTSTGVNIPIRDPFNLAHYPVAITELPNASVLLKIFTVKAHLARAVTVSLRAGADEEPNRDQP